MSVQRRAPTQAVGMIRALGCVPIGAGVVGKWDGGSAGVGLFVGGDRQRCLVCQVT